MSEWKIKPTDDVENKSVAEKEEAVLEQAVESGDVPKEYATPQDDDGVYKVNLDTPPVIDEPVEEPVIEIEPEKPIEDAVQQVQGEAEESVLRDERVEEPDEKEEFTLEPVEENEVQPEIKPEPVVEEQPPQVTLEQPVLPENVDKLVKFMEETGGTVEDYVMLNKDIDKMDNVSVLQEYYRQTKPHFDQDDINFHMDKQFQFDADNDDDREIRAKKLAFKEELYNAQKYLKGNKDKYYADLKLNKQNSVAPEYQQAFDYYTEQQKIQEENQKLVTDFRNKTDKVFGQEFKGFDFKVGESKYRVKVGDVAKTREHQSDINNFVKEFIGDDGSVKNVADYHKALYAARNADKLAQHFYEQGRADAIKQSAAKAKNIDMKPRQDAASIVTPSGQKYKVVTGDNSSKLRFKMKK